MGRNKQDDNYAAAGDPMDSNAVQTGDFNADPDAEANARQESSLAGDTHASDPNIINR
jgi:hypothetical protein